MKTSSRCLLILLLACGACAEVDEGGNFCATARCGSGTCNEAADRCDCPDGLHFDEERHTCVGPGDGDGGGGCDAGMCEPACTPDRTAGDFTFCAVPQASSYVVVVTYMGSGQLDLAASEIRLNEQKIDLASSFDSGSQTFTIRASNLSPSKYSYLFRLKDQTGKNLRPFFLPMWIGDGMRYAGFQWKDAILYQIMTDRFSNGNPGNDIDNTMGTLAQVLDPRNRWQGGDFAGITAKIKDGYFEKMGVNTLWISSPILSSHNSQPAVSISDTTTRYASYHGYHPLATGYTHLDNQGYANPIEPAFGTPNELHELVNEAHLRGIRVVPDFVANHVHKEARLYADHPDWFSAYNACDGRWDVARINCWFTTDMPDFDYGAHPDAIRTVVDHALWMIQEFNFDGFRADALKHMDDKFVRALKTAVRSEIETTVNDHSLSVEPTVFYMVGESLGGWARYHVRDDMVQGQVDEGYYNMVTNTLLNWQGSPSIRDLASFAIPNDTAYLTPQPTMGGSGGYPGAVMGNFFGNHDNWRALTQAGGNYDRLRLAQTFLMTSPGNVPMLYQGDDIGTLGQGDPDNRKMQRFTGLSTDEQASLANVQKAGLLREAHPALRRGQRQTVVVEDWFWVYKVTYQNDEVYVALNRDDPKSYSPPAGFVDALGNCTGGTVPHGVSCIFVHP